MRKRLFVIFTLLLLIGCGTRKHNTQPRFVKYNEVVSDNTVRSVDSIFKVNNLQYVPFEEWDKQVLLTADRVFIYNYFNIQSTVDTMYVISLVERGDGISFIKVRVEAKK